MLRNYRVAGGMMHLNTYVTSINITGRVLQDENSIRPSDGAIDPSNYGSGKGLLPELPGGTKT